MNATAIHFYSIFKEYLTFNIGRFRIRIKIKWNLISLLLNVRNHDPFYIITYFLKWVKTVGTDSIMLLHAIRHMKNTVVDDVITLNDIICKTCHYSWPG